MTAFAYTERWTPDLVSRLGVDMAQVARVLNERDEELEAALAAGGGVMDAVNLLWRFEAVANGGTGSADPQYPEIEAGLDGVCDLATLPAVTINGGDNLLAAYSATSKDSISLPYGAGQLTIYFQVTPVGTPDNTLTLDFLVGDFPGSVVAAVDQSLPIQVGISVTASETVEPMPFTAGMYAANPPLLTLGATTGTTTGSYLVTAVVEISGFVTLTPRDQIVD